MGDSDSEDDDDEFPRLRAPKMGEGAMVCVGRTRGESDEGSWAVRRTGGCFMPLTAGEGVPLSCCRHSEEQYRLRESVLSIKSF